LSKLLNKNRKVKRMVQDLMQRAASGTAGKGPGGAGTPSENPEATLPQTAQQAPDAVTQGGTDVASGQTPDGEDARKRRKQQMSNILGIQV